MYVYGWCMAKVLYCVYGVYCIVQRQNAISVGDSFCVSSPQQWEVRYAELCKLVSGASAVIHQLISAPGWSQNIQLREQGNQTVSAAHRLKAGQTLFN